MVPGALLPGRAELCRQVGHMKAGTRLRWWRAAAGSLPSRELLLARRAGPGLGDQSPACSSYGMDTVARWLPSEGPGARRGR